MRLKVHAPLAFFLAFLFFAHNTLLQPASAQTASDAERIARLESMLENLRQELKIPAYSAAIVKDQKVIWAKGFGYADLENKIPATEHTPYHLASLTKTFGSTILMQLVQEERSSSTILFPSMESHSRAKA